MSDETDSREPRLTAIVPCFNERDNVLRFERELIPALEGIWTSFEVLIVDDGSTDGTGNAANELAARQRDVRVLRLPSNRGLGGALREGFAAARGEWIATLDADLTFRPDSVKDLLDAAEKAGADLAAGSPFLRAGDMAGVPWTRRLPSLMLNAFYRGLFGLRLTAYTPILRVYRAARLRELPLASDGFEINAEIAVLALRAGWRVAEAPAALGARAGGVSKLRRVRELRRHAALLWRLTWRTPGAIIP